VPCFLKYAFSIYYSLILIASCYSASYLLSPSILVVTGLVKKIFSRHWFSKRNRGNSTLSRDITSKSLQKDNAHILRDDKLRLITKPLSLHKITYGFDLQEVITRCISHRYLHLSFAFPLAMKTWHATPCRCIPHTARKDKAIII
jgi:hypothetical protein